MQRRVLVIEDDTEMRELLAFNLKKAGFSVGTAVDGIEGLKKARTLRPDLILLDLMLPGLDGFSVCETLSRDAASANVPVIIITALTGQFARLSGLESGAREYLVKPFSLSYLISRVESLIARPGPIRTAA